MKNVGPNKRSSLHSDLNQSVSCETNVDRCPYYQSNPQWLPGDTLLLIESEKSRIGQELHDAINPLLAAAKLYMNLIQVHNNGEDKVKNTINALLQEAIDGIRKLSSDWVIEEMEHADLLMLITNHTEKIQYALNFALDVQYKKAPACYKMSQKQKVALYRIFQEQLTNIIKHSKACRVVVKIKELRNGIYLFIKDDGVGFDVHKHSTGIGLLNIRKRTQQLNGYISIISRPSKGCSLYVRLPFCI